MASLTENQKKLMNKLSEMFQFDQADLDFGIYRIMNYKRNEIKRFLEDELMSQVSVQLSVLTQSTNAVELAKIEKDIQNARSMDLDDEIKAGMIEKLQEKKAAYTVNTDITAVESDIYSHLTEFFSRYYDDGDFISQRRYKDGVYAIPYEGEEVKLYWANADQYYIKTSEYFKDYTFKTPHGQTVHFNIVEAETEKDNNKGKNRFFQLYADDRFALENNELFIFFEYKSGDKKKQADYNAEVMAEFEKVAAQYSDFAGLLTVTDGKCFLERQLNRYTARNTFDYFIHKDLDKFLNRELDFYIKNDVIFLDDIDEQDERKTKEYLLKAKIIRNIGKKIITFLAQIEDFQKMLWLKKKFVVESNYCITLDRVPKKLYPVIITNKAQVEEWVRLFAIDEITPSEDTHQVGYSDPLTIEFLEQNPYLVLDTALFPPEFKEQLVDCIDKLDEKLDGLLIHGENFQALNLLQERYREQVKCIYIDPPYNTDATPIIYKNGYKESSWIALMNDRLFLGNYLLNQKDGYYSIAIDDCELHNLYKLMESVLPGKDLLQVIVNHYPGSGTGRSNVSKTHEYNIFAIPNNADVLRGEVKEEGERERGFCRSGTGDNNYRSGRPNSFYAVLVNKDTYDIVGFEKPPQLGEKYPTQPTKEGYLRIYPLGSDGSERCWSLSFESAGIYKDRGMLKCTSNYVIKRLYFDETARELLQSIWVDKKYSAVVNGTNLLTSMFKQSGLFSFPKSVYTVKTAIEAGTFNDETSVTLDFFAGSGTTGHAVINLNREDDYSRKYILVEMGEYFDSVTKPRIQKVIYSEDWKDGKPVSRKGSSHAFKYLRLESYEDTLNNIEIEERDLQLFSNPLVKEQYMLHYLLPDESKSSVSLLNIEMLEHPFNYAMNITRRQESNVTCIDLVETFNFLIGLQVERSYARQSFDAEFTIGEYGGVNAKLKSGSTYHFKMVEGTALNGDRTLVIWRDMAGDKIKDNAVLDAFFERKKISTTDFEYKKIYVNGDNNLPNLKAEDESWKVILIEEEMKKRMFSIQNV